MCVCLYVYMCDVCLCVCMCLYYSISVCWAGAVNICSGFKSVVWCGEVKMVAVDGKVRMRV